MRRQRAFALALAACLLLPVAAQAQWKIGGKTITRDQMAQARALWITGSEVLNPQEIPDTWQAMRQTYGVLGNEQLDAQLNGVLERLQSTWHEPPPPARVYATPDPAFRAFATTDGGIIIAAGMLASMESEDELAALIAHEYAHLLLGHNAPSLLETTALKFGGVADTYLGMRHGALRGDPSQALVRDMLARHLVAEGMQTALAPARSRKDETSADALAADLLLAAGYSPVGLADMLGRMEAWEARLQATREEQEQRQTSLQVVLTAHATDSRMDGTARGDRNQLIAAGLGDAFNKLGQGIKRLRRQHDTADLRLDKVLAHLDKAHPDHDRPELRPLPWAGNAGIASLLSGVDEVHQLMRQVEEGDSGAATATAARVRSGPAANTPYARSALLFLPDNRRRDWEASAVAELTRPDSLYRTHFMALDRMAESSSQRALEALEVSRASLGDTDELLPHSVRLNRKAGKRDAASDYALRCQATGDEALQRACAESAQ
ncbi:M48 family metalloprotease [Luteimonas sp. MJ204]|uniref:M48 family metalloprotease n=1 Tax=Luteimonas sp. MJ145 TaxID=3129234 RepID=UPI0031BB8729